MRDEQRVGAAATLEGITVVDRDVTVADVAGAAGSLVVVTVGDEPAVVDGAVGAEALAAVTDRSVPVWTVAAPAPPTVRPSLPLRDLVGRLRHDEAPWILVTTPDGALVGGIERAWLLGRAAADELP